MHCLLTVLVGLSGGLKPVGRAGSHRHAFSRQHNPQVLSCRGEHAQGVLVSCSAASSALRLSAVLGIQILLPIETRRGHECCCC
jgi:hypothetical protein